MLVMQIRFLSFIACVMWHNIKIIFIIYKICKAWCHLFWESQAKLIGDLSLIENISALFTGHEQVPA